jgi:hypothetical protein
VRVVSVWLPPLTHPHTHSQQASLASLIESSGGKLALTEPDAASLQTFYRDTIKEDVLAKLPPPNNHFQAWRQRWFKLVISLQRTLSGGPVSLEYYEKRKSRRPKGVIDLDRVVRISRPDISKINPSSDKRFRGIQLENIFEIEMPNRVYPVQADSSAAVDNWVRTLRDVLGMDEPPRLPSSLQGTGQRQFSGVILNREVHNSDGLVILSDSKLVLRCPQVWRVHHCTTLGVLHPSTHSPTHSLTP